MIKNKDISFVGLQLILFVLYLFDVQWLRYDAPYGLQMMGSLTAIIGVLVLVIAILQLNRHLSPFPRPKINGQLIQNGLYAFVRHPIYTGIILASWGHAVHKGSGWKLFISLVLYLLFFFKSRYEEALLRKKYPQYKAYSLHTGRFFPRLGHRHF